MNINIETNITQTLTTEQVDILARDLCGVMITLSDTGVPKYNFTTTGISATCENVHQESVDALRLKGINVTYTNSYILFKDPEVVRILTAKGVMQEGEGITAAQASELPTGSGSANEYWWGDNTTIKEFDEIKYFGRLKNGAHQMGQWFTNATNLESVDLTGFTQLFGYRLFENCKNLEYFHGRNNTPNTLNLEDLTRLNASFNGCLKLHHIASLGSITSIGGSVFQNCTNLETVNLPSSCIDLGSNCFKSDSKLHTINLSHVTAIRNNAFEGCSSLEYCDGPNSTQGELSLPNLTLLEGGAFKGCSKLTSVASLGNITSIGSTAFENCTNLATINFSNTITSVGNNAFNNTAWYNNQPNGHIIINNTIYYNYKGTKTGNIVIPTGILTISGPIFNKSSITSLEIPVGVSVIPTLLCQNCRSLITIILPSTITTISQASFEGCDLENVTIPENVVTIGTWAFQHNTHMQWIKVLAVQPPSLAAAVFYDTNYCPIYVPAGSVDAYKSASGWSEFASRIEAIPTT